MLSELDEFEWADIVRWHKQHQRIKEEMYQLERLRQEMTQVQAMTRMLGPQQQRAEEPD